MGICASHGFSAMKWLGVKARALLTPHLGEPQSQSRPSCCSSVQPRTNASAAQTSIPPPLPAAGAGVRCFAFKPSDVCTREKGVPQIPPMPLDQTRRAEHTRTCWLGFLPYGKLGLRPPATRRCSPQLCLHKRKRRQLAKLSPTSIPGRELTLQQAPPEHRHLPHQPQARRAAQLQPGEQKALYFNPVKTQLANSTTYLCIHLHICTQGTTLS